MIYLEPLSSIGIIGILIQIGTRNELLIIVHITSNEEDVMGFKVRRESGPDVRN